MRQICDTPKTNKKHKWRVYYSIELWSDRVEEEFTTPWKIAGDTWAVSEDKAINNVRYRTMGKTPMSMPVSCDGYRAKWINWKAEILIY